MVGDLQVYILKKKSQRGAFERLPDCRESPMLTCDQYNSSKTDPNAIVGLKKLLNNNPECCFAFKQFMAMISVNVRNKVCATWKQNHKNRKSKVVLPVLRKFCQIAKIECAASDKKEPATSTSNENQRRLLNAGGGATSGRGPRISLNSENQLPRQPPATHSSSSSSKKIDELRNTITMMKTEKKTLRNKYAKLEADEKKLQKRVSGLAEKLEDSHRDAARYKKKWEVSKKKRRKIEQRNRELETTAAAAHKDEAVRVWEPDTMVPWTRENMHTMLVAQMNALLATAVEPQLLCNTLVEVGKKASLQCSRDIVTTAFFDAIAATTMQTETEEVLSRYLKTAMLLHRDRQKAPVEGVEDPPYAHSPLPVDKNKLREVVQELKKDEQLIVRKKRPSADDSHKTSDATPDDGRRKKKRPRGK